jgi:hypothetical protein
MTEQPQPSQPSEYGATQPSAAAQPTPPAAQYPPAPYPPASQSTPYQPPMAPYAQLGPYGAPSPYAPPPYGYQPQVRSPEQWQAYVKMQVGSGRPPATLLAEMAQSGVPQANAYQMVQAAVASLRQRAYTVLAVGVAVAVVAFVLSVATEANARAHGGTYVLLYGPLGGGIAAIVYGVMLLRKVPRL